MSTRVKSRRALAAASAVGVAGLVVGGLLMAAGASVAEPVDVDKTLTYSCPFPLIGTQKLAVRIQATIDVPATEGGEIVTRDFSATATVPETATQGLTLVGAKTVEGTAVANITLENAGAALPISLPGLIIPKTDVPASGPFDTVASGPVPTAFPKAGPTSIIVGDFSTTLTPRRADGAETGLGTFTAPCTLDPGQDTTLLSFTVGAPTGTTDPTTDPTTTDPSTTDPTSADPDPTTTTVDPTGTEPPPADAIKVDKVVNYTCPFPLIGVQPLKVRIQADVTPPPAVGGEVVTTNFSATATVPETATQGLTLVGAKTIEGTADAGVVVDNAGEVFDLPIPGLTIPKTDVPASGSFDTVAGGTVPSRAVENPGLTVITVGDFSTTLTPRKADGTETGLGTFTAPCTLVDGQDLELLRFELGDGPTVTTTPTTDPTTTTTVPTTTDPTTTAPTTDPTTTDPTTTDPTTTVPTTTDPTTTKPTTTTPTTTKPTTTQPTTTKPTTTTTKPTTTTDPSQTTTEPTTTEPTTTQPTTTEPTEPPTDTSWSPTDGPTDTTGPGVPPGDYPSPPPSGGNLADTGVSILLPLGIGAALVAAGVAALLLQRRRAARR
ncbi:DUF6801 domain-containing protein [Actinokineospora sp. UTMC 2448]|uniref:DUF6801 domain-containing protein n=1 Tax=Actinokineospora sp. UTMC 2448 TaxID=2268449 RepID=UPI0021641BE6|nr:DUF6801 domain-containing protein [Actinokineospora sp. UTMC 2448]UVS78900.1 hypothetical protein Actkin_02637 [Actinokineospora sp. UTMC 2448]